MVEFTLRHAGFQSEWEVKTNRSNPKTLACQKSLDKNYSPINPYPPLSFFSELLFRMPSSSRKTYTLFF